MSYAEKAEQFKLVIKRVLKTKLSRNLDTLTGYRSELIEANNSIVSFIIDNYSKAKRAEQHYFDEQLEKIRTKIIESFAKLNCSTKLGSLTELIEEENIGPVGVSSEKNSGSENGSDEESGQGSSTQSHTVIIGSEQSDFDPSRFNTQFEQQSSIPSVNMSTDMDVPAFLRLCGSTMNKPFSGDPLTMSSFIDAIDLLNTLATSTALRQILFSFIKTKLEGRAREFVVDTVTTVDGLKQALTNNIKPDNSKVIEGRMLGLKFNLNTADEFSQKAESLADALRRTLIIEGVTPTKANEMAVEKTIELCRRSTHSPIIKSVLEAAHFNQPKDVVAKLITQVDKTKSEAQVLSFDSNNKRGRGSKNNNFNKRNNSSNNDFQNNSHNNYNNSNGNRGGRGRGRGRGGNRGRWNNNNNGYNNNHNGYNNYNNYNDRGNVRVFTNQGNSEAAPQVLSLMGPGPSQLDHHQHMHNHH